MKHPSDPICTSCGKPRSSHCQKCLACVVENHVCYPFGGSKAELGST